MRLRHCTSAIRSGDCCHSDPSSFEGFASSGQSDGVGERITVSRRSVEVSRACVSEPLEVSSV